MVKFNNFGSSWKASLTSTVDSFMKVRSTSPCILVVWSPALWSPLNPPNLWRWLYFRATTTIKRITTCYSPCPLRQRSVSILFSPSILCFWFFPLFFFHLFPPPFFVVIVLCCCLLVSILSSSLSLDYVYHTMLLTLISVVFLCCLCFSFFFFFVHSPIHIVMAYKIYLI